MKRFAQFCGFIACSGTLILVMITPASSLGGTISAIELALVFSFGTYMMAYELWLKDRD